MKISDVAGRPLAATPGTPVGGEAQGERRDAVASGRREEDRLGVDLPSDNSIGGTDTPTGGTRRNTSGAAGADLLVLGVPAPQGSKSAVVRGDRAVLIEGASTAGRQKHRAWRHAVAAAARTFTVENGPVPDGPLHVTLTFSLSKPKSKPKRLRWVAVKPDLDKLVRSTLDGLADGGLVAHDQRVVSIAATKRYAEPGLPTGCRVEIETVDERDGDLARDLLGD